jgi:glycosyltransferase involved in cell wall biosynthesis
MPLISVVICTLNRADRLAKALASVLGQEGDFEILVVDNGSTDRTSDVVHEMPSTKIRYLVEPVLGLCHARNRGWRAAFGRYVAYLDDDAIALPGWIRAIEEAFATHPRAGVAGGRVEPIWEGDRPEWLSDGIALGLALLDWSEKPKILRDLSVEWLVGTNMVIPSRLLEEIGGFHPALDRRGRRLLASGDVFLQKQIQDRGYDCVYYPAIAVRHAVPTSRLTKSWFRRRYYWQGVSDIVMDRIEHSPSLGVRLGRAARTASALLRAPEKIASLAIGTDDPARFEQNCMTWIALGQIAGLLGVARE